MQSPCFAPACRKGRSVPIRFAMDIPPALLQFLVSLVAILALAGLARWLGLGPEQRLGSEGEARRAAAEAVAGFEAETLAVDMQGRGAILKDRDGRILLLRPHGSQIAGRILTPAASARLEEGVLVVDTAERRYGAARLRIQDASAWMQAVEALKSA